jgi:hypothetical protein
MHAGFDAQERPLVRAGLDRLVERAACRAVDRTLIAARVGQPLLERLEFVGAHLGRVEARRAGGQTRAEQKGDRRGNRRASPPNSISSCQGVPRRRADAVAGQPSAIIKASPIWLIGRFRQLRRPQLASRRAKTTALRQAKLSRRGPEALPDTGRQLASANSDNCWRPESPNWSTRRVG